MNHLLARHQDLLLALFVVAVAGMLLVPLPTPLIDLLLVLNLAAALLLLLVGLYMPNALALSTFPAILLLTTLFRVSLNVASTRLILSQADAGRVIEGFGTFLIRGDVAVGLIIFTIITIVNFIVIARGAARVSEVAARFTLDALPGKQMAIDADLRSGLLTPEEAQRKRDELRTESQLYGAMDGSMKFVQGDAIAGLFIIATNLFGGLYMGVQQGMSIGEAVDTYMVLTVGDGLVTQIPALLISICAGIVVTRVSSSDQRTLSADLAFQLFRSPIALGLAGGIVALIGIIPGLPWYQFLLVGGLMIAGATMLRRRETSVLVPQTGGRLSSSESLRLPAPTEHRTDDMPALSSVELYLDSSGLYRQYTAGAIKFHQWWSDFGDEFEQQYGLPLPNVRVFSADVLALGEYELRLRGATIERGRCPMDAYLVEIHAHQALICGLEVLGELAHPFDGSLVSWVRATTLARRVIDGAQLRTFEPLHVIGLTLASFLRQNPEEVLTLTDVYRMLKHTEKKYPGLVSEAFVRAASSVPRLAEVVHALARDGLSVHEIRPVLEAVAAYCAAHGQQLADDQSVEIADVVQFVRSARRRDLVTPFLSTRHTLRVITLDPEVEEQLEALQVRDDRGAVDLGAEALEGLERGITPTVKQLHTKGVMPCVVLTRPDLRRSAAAVLRTLGIRVPVISTEELEMRLALEPAGVWAVG